MARIKSVRNVWCPNYSNCLDAATATGGEGINFTCTGCEREFDYSAIPKDAAELKEDCRGCMALLLAAYQDLKPSQARNQAGWL